MFDSVDPKQSFPALEEGILKYWREEDTFKRSMELRTDAEPFSFYDGPPFATGLPHYGHIMVGTLKDVIPRYQTMRGKFVKRRFGWDCHGLPVENLIEKEYKLKSKRDIELMGVKQFNDLCRGAVQRFTREWRMTVERLGRWVDMDWDYRTMDPEYMESIWWVFKQLYDKGLIYEGYKPMHVCTRCATPLSNFEVTQAYADRTDWSVYVTFPLKDDPQTSILAWTTTPWSLPGNFFLAMGEEFPYVKVKEGDTFYILAEPLVEKIFKDRTYEVVGKVKARDFEGKKYEPLFPYFYDKVITGNEKGETYGQKAYHVVLDDRVVVNEGTGIVHFASAYGDDGFDVAMKHGIGIHHHVTIDGHFTEEVTDFAGLEVKPKGDEQKSDKLIAKYLQEKGRLFADGPITHSYPHCWRCDTPLLNYAASSWFVGVEKIKKQMIAVNDQMEWVPDAIRSGRFGKWIEGARDWAISRSRYWGTPLPIWRNTQTGAMEVLGSRDDLMSKAPGRFTKITFARHAQSQGNVDCIYQGKLPGTNLTAEGKKQAKALADKLKDDAFPVNIIYHSPLARTTQTAEAVAKLTGAKLIVDERLREVEFGEYEGKHIDFEDLTFVKARRTHKLENNQVESIFHFPGMETWSSVEERSRSFLDEILEKHRGDHVVVVTHADTIMNFTHIFTGEDKNKIVHQPYPGFAQGKTFYWDHERKGQLDLHKETVDDIKWNIGAADKKKTHDPLAVQLTLMRHGTTDFVDQGRQQGWIDIPLNANGIMQIKEAISRMDQSDFDVIVTSALTRTRQSGELIADAWSLPIFSSDLFNEQRLGDWEGKTKEEVLAQNPQLTPNFALTEVQAPNGEDILTFENRLRRAREYLLKQFPGKRVLLVGHSRVIRRFAHHETGRPYEDRVGPAETIECLVRPRMERIADVLDCWFESGSMPYAQEHFPFEGVSQRKTAGKKSRSKIQDPTPPGFPADFIAEALDQTRGWFYTLTVLATALYDQPAFRHCIVNGIVLAEDGKKMSKKLKNYPEPTEIVNKYGADSVRFALMSSQAVRGEDLRFSEKLVEETLRNVLLPLWNSYNLFVTYANAAGWTAPKTMNLKSSSTHPLDVWIIAKMQNLVNEMTKELDGYDLSATCAHLSDSIDDLTNWYIRLNRRRFAGKEQGQTEAFDTLYRVLIANCQLLAPFCPFITESIYLNLVENDHGSIHFSDWPAERKLTKNELEIIALMRNTKTVVNLGHSLRSEAKVKVRMPLQSITFALPPTEKVGVREDIITEELNVKAVKQVADPGELAKQYVFVDARKVGPRLGKKVQDVILFGKTGKFKQHKDGSFTIMDEKLSKDEARLMFQGAEGSNVASDHGIVVSLDTTLTDELKLEGLARDLIRAIQKLRKDSGLAFTDTIKLSLTNADDLVQAHKDLIIVETKSQLGDNGGILQEIELEERKVGVRFEKA